MAEVSKFFTGTSPGDAGAYSADQFADFVRNIVLAVDADAGPLQGSGAAPDLGLTVTQTGVASANVQISTGAAVVHGYFYELTASQQLTVAANGSGNPRIDTVVLRLDWALQTVRLVLLQGTPGATPAAPTLTQSEGVRWEVPLADIAVANGFATIVNANITNRRYFANAGGNLYLWDVLNNSGGALVEGDVVIWDTTADRAVTTSTTQGDPKVAGVWLSRTPASGYGRLLVRGVGRVNANAAVTRGSALVQSTTAKQAAILAAGTSGQKAVAFTLNATSGAGLVECYVDAPLQYPFATASGHVQRTGAANYATSSNVFADMDAANLIITLITTRSVVNVEATFTLNATGAGGAFFDIILDSTTRFGGAAGAAFDINTSGGSTQNPITVVARFTGLTPGTHTFKLQFASAVNAQTTTVLNNNSPIVMRAWEQ